LRPTLSLAVALLALLALAGCGRKGPLELPPGAPPESAAQSAAIESRVLGNEDHPGVIQPPNSGNVPTPAQKQAAAAAAKVATPAAEGVVPRPINAPPQAKTGFFLDPLL
jgi:predicted small lipoprotein YifL